MFSKFFRKIKKFCSSNKKESGPPPPPPPPGCSGSVQLPHWRSEPLPSHLAPTKEEIEKEQYANLPDKLLNTLNKDKKPFTYTPQGVSGVEKGKLDLSNIRSPRMKKRLMANLADDEESDSERVTRSETPDLLTKPKPLPNTRRAITPDVISLQKQIYAPVLPKEPVLPQDKLSPVIHRHAPQQKQEQLGNSIPQNEFESLLSRQMHDMEDSVIKPFQLFNNDADYREVRSQEQASKNENAERAVPIKLENTQEVVKPKPDHEPESTKPVEVFANRLSTEIVFPTCNKNLSEQEQEPKRNEPQTNGNNGKDINRVRDSYDNNGNRNKSNPWDSDLLKHVLDGGLQEEIEKFEQVSLETQESLNQNRARSSQIDEYSSPKPAPTWSPPNHVQDPYNRNQSPSPFGSLNRKPQSRSPQPPPKPQWSGQQYWSESPSPSPQPFYQHNSPSTDPIYHGGHIPSKTFQTFKPMTGNNDAEVPNYNSRPKPFYLCSPPPTPTATPPPQSMYQQKQQPKPAQTSTFGNKFPPQKINYQNEIFNREMSPTPQTRYIENSQMFSQTTYRDDGGNNLGIRTPDPYVNHGTRSPAPQVHHGIRSPDPYANSGIRSPDTYAEPRPILKKKLPPSEQPPDPTPSKYMGGNIPSRSFRFLQLMTGEDIENQFTANYQNDFKRNSSPKTGCSSANSGSSNSNTPRSSGYSSNLDFGTDF